MNDFRAPRLAIIIPAFKTNFLRETLQSIASQTDNRFQLYVFDDGSREPVAEIVREFSERLTIKYHRFENNLGGISLVQQWERCIHLTCEPWIWLFSDDDFMDATCVGAFFEELENTDENHDIYRFNTVCVNSKKKSEVENPRHPQDETGAGFLTARLGGGRTSTIQEVVFSRRAWETVGGIPEFPMAWASDDAFIVKLGLRRSIRTISGPRVNWRLSGLNISDNKSTAAIRTKVKASELFVEWAVDFFEKDVPANERPEKQELMRLTERWFFNYVFHSWKFLNLRSCLDIEALAARVWGRKRGYGFFKALKLNYNLAARKYLPASINPGGPC